MSVLCLFASIIGEKHLFLFYHSAQAKGNLVVMLESLFTKKCLGKSSWLMNLHGTNFQGFSNVTCL